MSYKKYIKRGGKVYGPYIYHSKKINGRVTTEYLGKYEKKIDTKRLLNLILVSLFLLVFFAVIVNNETKFSSSFTYMKDLFSRGFNHLTGFSVLGENDSAPEINFTLPENTSLEENFIQNDSPDNTLFNSNILTSGFILGAGPPILNFTNPTPSNASTQGGNSIYVNVSSSDASDHSVWLDWNRSLIGYWSFDSINSSGTVFDNSTYGNNGNATGAAYISGIRGYAYDFTGSSNEIINLSSFNYNLTGYNYTLSAWIKPGLMTALKTAVSKMYVFELDRDSANNRTLCAIGNGTGWITPYAYSPTYTPDQWHHVICSYNGTTLIAYLDGVAGTPVTNTGPIGNNNTNNFLIGRSTTGYYWNGSIDEVMLFSRALSLQEIKALYNASTNQYYNNFTSLANGNYNFTAYAIDASGNLNKTETRSINVSLINNPLTTCTTLSIANTIYTLTSNVSSNSTCFTVSANNVTLNGGGYTINYSANGSTLGYGVYVNANFTTVNNLNIVEGTANVTTENGIFLNYVNNCTIFNNSVVTLNSTSQGILVYRSLNNTLISNKGTVTNGGANRGIYLSGSNYTILINNTGTSIFGYGIYLLYSSNDTLINNTGMSNSSYGIQFDTSSNNTLFDNTGMSNSSIGIRITTSSNNFLINNTATSNLNYSFNLYASLNNIIINQIAISSSDSVNSYGIFELNSNNTVFQDCLNISGITGDIYLTSNSINNTFINCSYNTSKETVDAGSKLMRIWYYRAYVNDSFGNNINNANVTAFNVTGDYNFNLTTGVDGYTSIEQIIDYVNTGTRTYYSNYNITATNTTSIVSHSYNATSNQNNLKEVFTFNLISGESTNYSICYSCDNCSAEIGNASAGTTISLNTTLTTIGTCIDFNGKDDIIFDCQTNSIIGDSSGIDYGIYLFGSLNNTIRNCNLSGFYRGLDLESGSNGNTIFNTTSNSNTHDGLYASNNKNNNITNSVFNSNVYNGIYLFGDNNNTIIGITANSNTQSGIYISSSNNNTLENIIANSNMQQKGISISLSNNNTIINATSNSNAIGITIGGDNNTLINITVNSNLNQGIWMTSGSNNIFRNVTSQENNLIDIEWDNCNNVLENATGSSGRQIGFYNSSSIIQNKEFSEIILCNAHNSTINNITIIGSDSYKNNGFYIYATNNSIISNVTSSNNYVGISIYSSNNNTFMNITADFNSARGISISDSNNNIFTNITGMSDNIGLFLTSSNYNNFTNNIWIGNSTGIYILSSRDNLFINDTGKANIDSATYILNSENNTLINHRAEGYFSVNYSVTLRNSNNTLFQDCINISGTIGDIYIYNYSNSSFNNLFLNCSYNTSKEIVLGEGNTLIRSWYYRAYVNDTNNNPINNVNVTAFNSTNDYNFNLTTNSSGYTPTYNIIDYVNNGTRSYYSNYNITATNTTSSDSHLYNATSNQNNLKDVFTFDLSLVSDCTTLSTANTIYTLTSNVTSNSTCFTITADNITIDGAGYTINYSANGSTVGYGVYVNGYNFTTIKNLNIVEGTANVTTENGIFLNYVNNCTIFNNSVVTLNSTSQGILIYHSLNNTLISNTGTVTNGGANRGIYLSGSNYTILINNTGTSIFGYGIYLLYSSNDTLINNTGISNASAGIQVDTSPNNTLFDNTGTSNTGRGIYIVTSSNCNLIGNTGISNNNSGIYLSSSLNNILTNNTGISNASNGIGLSSSSNYNILTNNTGISNASNGISDTCSNNNLTSNTGISNSSRGIYIGGSLNDILNSNTGISNGNYGIYLYNSNNTILTNNTGTSNSSYAVYLYSSFNNILTNTIAKGYLSGSEGLFFAYSVNTTMQDCVNVSGISADVHLTSNSANNTFLNCSYNTSKETVQDAGSTLIREWYYKAYVNDTNGNAVNNVNVTVFNVSNNYNFNLTTDATGYTPIGQIIEYFNNGGTTSYYSNYNIIATNTTSIASHSYNVTSNQSNLMDVFTFDLIPPVISIVYPSNNTNTSNIGINVNYTVSDNIAISSCWYSNSSGKANYSLGASCSNITGINWLQGINNVTIWVNDTGNNMNSSSISFFVDNTNPQINITYPSNNTNTTNTGLNINYTVTDNLKIGACWYSNDTYLINSSLGTTCNNITNMVWSEGQHNVTVYVNDSAGNLNWSRVGFRIDNIPPYFTNLVTQTIYTNQTLSYNMTAADIGVGLDSFKINWTNIFSITRDGNLTNISGLSVGNYYINVTINDTLNNLNSTIVLVNVSQGVYIAPPNINFTDPTPSEGQTVTINSVVINVSSNDTSDHSVFLDWNSGLVGWWSFDSYNNSGIFDNSSYGNFANFNGTSTADIISGIRGKAVNFSGISNTQGIVVTTLNFTNFTMSMWIKPGTMTSLKVGLSRMYVAEIDASGSNTAVCAIGNGTAWNTPYAYSPTYTQDAWHYVTCVFNGTTLVTYLDGVAGTPVTKGGLPGNNSNPLRIGRSENGGYSWNGSIDEVMIFSRALSSQEINASYNASLYQYYNNFTNLLNGNYNFTAWAIDASGNVNKTETRSVNVNADTTPPYFTIIPANASINYNSPLEAIFAATDSNAFGYYNVNDSRFIINTTGGLKNNTILGVGTYIMNVSVNDTFGNFNSTMYRVDVNQIASQTSLIFDKATPQTYPTPITPICSIITGTGTPTLSNGTSGSPEVLGVGTWAINCSLVSSQNYTASSNTTNYVISQNSSAVVYTYLNNSRSNITIYNNTAIWLNGTLLNVSGTINLYKNGTSINNGTSPIGNLTSFNATGIYNITAIYSGNANYSGDYETWWINVTNIPIDTVYPIFSNYWDNNASLTDSGVGKFNVTLANTNGTVLLTFNNVNYTASNSSGNTTTFNATVPSISAGTYNYYWVSYGNGTNHNLNTSIMRSYTVNATADIIPPVVSLVSPANASTWISSSTVTFTYNVTDANSIANCSLIINRSLDQTATSVTKNTSQTFTKSMSNANYNWSVNCTDVAGNQGNSSTYSLTVSYTAPSAPSGGGGGGGGGGSSVSNQTTGTTHLITGTPLNTIEIDINQPPLDLIKLIISVTRAVSNIPLTVTQINNIQPQTGIGLPAGQSYQTFTINTDLNNSDIQTALLIFRINKTWLSNQNGTIENLRMYREPSGDNQWTPLTTTFMGNDSQYYFLSSVSPGFSTFVMFLGRYDCQPGARRCYNWQSQICLGNSTWLITEKCTFGCDQNGKCFGTAPESPTIYSILIVILSISIIITFFSIVARIRQRKKNKPFQ